MEPFKHTHRSSLLFHIYGVLTLGISSIVTLCRLQNEYERLRPYKENEKHPMSFVGAFFLGFVTLGIVPFVWTVRLAARYGALAKESGMEKPRVSGKFFGLWCTFGLLLIIGPWLAFRRLFLVSNALQMKANALMQEAEEEKRKENPVVEMATKEEIGPQENPEPDVLDETVAEEPKEEAESIAVEAPLDPIESLLKKYESCGEGRFAVRFSKKGSPLRTFAKKEDAMAFAKELTEIRHCNLRYVKLK